MVSFEKCRVAFPSDKTGSFLQENKRSTLKIKINFLGWISRIKLNKIYEKSHILILPTQSEGFPKVIDEAASYGCIPMVTNISPINQYIEHGNNGLLLDNPSINNIQDCILKVDKGVFNLKDISKTALGGVRNDITINYNHDYGQDQYLSSAN